MGCLYQTSPPKDSEIYIRSSKDCEKQKYLKTQRKTASSTFKRTDTHMNSQRWKQYTNDQFKLKLDKILA